MVTGKQWNMESSTSYTKWKFTHLSDYIITWMPFIAMLDKYSSIGWICKAAKMINMKLEKTRQVFVKHGCPWRQQSQNITKLFKSYILTQPHSQGYEMSVKCEEPINELTEQVWLLYHHQHFKYCTLFVSGTEIWTDRQRDGQTDKRMDNPNTRCPWRTFQARRI